ncbi:major facilitator superfamily domain-containingprotein [Purpureocillium lilacinum]|uniref:Major facilitator superfamily domain-containingprotein n=1 Tax=Purpureocillium lilacinum TaxID=33203 RepID=A0A179F0I7_PURLI|nr:major facilitator superfamily domain-containingprotein [Purpureocillium lilacinum]
MLASKSHSSISWIGSVQVCFLIAGGSVAGPLFDKYGSSLRQVIAVPGLMAVASTMMTSLCTEYYQFMLAQGVLGGIASGMLFAPAMACVGQYFHNRRATALGIAAAGSSLGGVIIPITLSQMLQRKSLGFGWSVRVVGFIILVMMIVAILTVKERLPPRRGKVLVLSAFTCTTYAFTTLGLFLMNMGIFTPFFYLPQSAQERGMQYDLASHLLAVLNSASVLGRVLAGLIADRLGRFNTLAINGMCSGLLLLCWPAISSNVSIFIFSSLYGFFSGGVVSLFPPCVAQVTPHTNQIGAYLGMAMVVSGIAGLVGSPIFGTLLERSRAFTQPGIFSGVVMLCGVCFIIMARLRQVSKVVAFA